MNLSAGRITLAQMAEGIDISYGDFHDFSGASCGCSWITGRDSYIDLAPGQATSFPIRVNPGLLAAPADSRLLRLHYLTNGNKFGVNAWIGTVVVRIGPTPLSR